MIGHRPPTILTIAITALAAISSPIWGFEIENYWLNTARPYVVANAWSWVVTVLDYLSGFWGGVLAVLLVWGLTEAFITWRRNRYNPTQVSPTEAPTLTLEFGPEEPFVINAPFVRGSTLPPTTGFLRTVRVKATNHGGRTIHGCVARLTAVSIQKNGRWIEIFSDPIDLLWAFNEGSETRTVDLPPSSHRFFATLSADNINNELEARTTPTSLRLFNILHDPNTYRLRVQVFSSDDIHSDPLSLDVSWEGNWASLGGSLTSTVIKPPVTPAPQLPQDIGVEIQPKSLHG